MTQCGAEIRTYHLAKKRADACYATVEDYKNITFYKSKREVSGLLKIIF